MSKAVTTTKRAATPAPMLHQKIDATMIAKITPIRDPEILHPSDVGSARCRDMIAEQQRVCDDLRPFTAERTAALRAVIATAMTTRTPVGLRRAIAKLLDSFPQSKPPETYRESLEEHLAGYSDAIVHHGTYLAVRSHKFLPSIHELLEHCEAAKGTWQHAEACLRWLDGFRPRYLAALERNLAMLENPPRLVDRRKVEALVDRIETGMKSPAPVSDDEVPF